MSFQAEIGRAEAIHNIVVKIHALIDKHKKDPAVISVLKEVGRDALFEIEGPQPEWAPQYREHFKKE